MHESNYRKRHFARACAAAGLVEPDPKHPGKVKRAHSPKNLRDTFASQLLSAGENVLVVSSQLGHTDFSVTAKHYAAYCGDASAGRNVPLLPGEVAADRLARLAMDQGPHCLQH